MAAESPAKPKYQNQLNISARPGVSAERRLADVGVDPAANSMATLLRFSKGTFGVLPMTENYEAVADAVQEVRDGNLAALKERWWRSRSRSTPSSRNWLADRLPTWEYIEASERYMLALKAQAQCRATIETIAAIKSPPVVFARQANISSGPQQVNNGGAAARADNPAQPPNELWTQAMANGWTAERRAGQSATIQG